MRKNLLFAFAMFVSLSVGAQNIVRGIVKVADTDEPAVGAVVTLQGQKTSVVTDEQGRFVFEVPKNGDEVLTIVQDGYDVASKAIVISALEPLDLGVLSITSKEAEMREELTEAMFAEMGDVEFDDEDGLSSQSISGLLSSRGDIFGGAVTYAFSPVRYHLRGYDQRYESTYINGINFNDQERGRFNYSSIGGLNDASRNKELIQNYEPNSYTFGNVGNTTNIDMRASRYAKGTKLGLSGTNRAYWLRAYATYATGIMDNGWAVAVSGAYRWSYEGRNEGTFYNSGAAFVSAEKIFNPHHSINIVAYGAPTERAGSSALSKETVDLTSIYYNPYWGYQNGKKRNSRIVHSLDPTLLLNYDWNIAEGKTFKVGLGTHYSMYSNSALSWYNAPDPRPDYYRNLPSYYEGGWSYNTSTNEYVSDDALTNQSVITDLSAMWANNTDSENWAGQLDWTGLYTANNFNNIVNKDGMAKYMIERRHNNLFETALNAIYEDQSRENLNIVVGLEAKYTKGTHYKTIDDLLGANQWYDIDPFSDRDMNDLTESVGMSQTDVANTRINDLDNVDENGNAKVVKDGDKFGYHYDIDVKKVSAFVHNDWNLTRNVELYYGLKLTYSNFQRIGYMNNGRAWYLSQQLGETVKSSGKGDIHNFVDPSFKAGAIYKFNGHHRVIANVLAETRAPLSSKFYISQRTMDRSVQDFFDKYPTVTSSLLKHYGLTEKILSYDAAYVLTYPRVRAKASLYRTHSLGGIETNGYYNDEYHTFINQTMYNVNKIYQGGELAASYKINSSFTLSGALAYNEAHYTNDPMGVESTENGMPLDGQSEVVDKILLSKNTERGTKAIKVASGPQLAGTLKLNYFHQKMWFADISISAFGENYLGVSPSRFTQGIITGTRVDGSTAKVWYGGNVTDPEVIQANIDAFTTQESLFGDSKLYNHIMVDASVGKLIYLKGGKSININLSLNNLTNNTGMKTGGWQQGRIPSVGYQQKTYKVSANVEKYPAKYYYAWGTNFFLNVGYRF